MKVMYIADKNFTISGLKNRLEQFTVNNGCYPDEIQMDKEQVDRYQFLLLFDSDRNNLTFRGIKVKEL
jgi:hypothetical protein